MKDENKKRIFVLVIIFLIIPIISFGYIKLSGYSILSIEKCETSNTDDCWHALAHQTLNSNFCNNIINNETKEHCFEHIPK